MHPEERFEKHWRSKPEPLGVALGGSLDMASMVSSRLPSGQALLRISCPEYRAASTRLSGFVTLLLLMHFLLGVPFHLLHRRLSRVHL